MCYGNWHILCNITHQQKGTDKHTLNESAGNYAEFLKNLKGFHVV
jgi:hypothetical protein